MDKARLVEATAEKAVHHGTRPLDVADVERVIDALFGTVEYPGTIAQALKHDESVVLGSFGSFRSDGRDAAFRAGRALVEYLDENG
ncbi:hypothetical protein ABZ354_11285 [Streptomyces sp. NPDC005925]|uniref:HU family DNA-binding protein n=1 Tax=Streptomyces sp. NPDC005925 TaxID=3157172 RepID=UPI0033EBED32